MNQSTWNKGTSEDASTPPAEIHAWHNAPNVNSRLQVIVVEDNAGDFLLIETMLLEIRDFQKDIVHVTTLADALKALHTVPVDVVLLDLSLPDSYGIDSFTRISQAVPNIPVLILSGLNDMRFAHDAVKNGAQDYLVKGEFEEKLLAKSITYSIERKRSIELLRESQETYKLLFEHNPIPMYVRQKDSFRILGANQSAIDHFGYSEEELLQMTVTDLHPPEEAEMLMKVIRENQGNFNEPRVFHHVCKDGRVILVECRVREMLFNGEQCYLVLADDITEKRKVQEEVLFQADVLRNVRDTIFVTDRNGIITYWNEGAEQTFGYSGDEMLGKSYDLLYPQIDKAKVKQEIQDVILGRMQQWESRMISKGDHIIWSDNKASLLHNDSGQVTGYIRVCKDVTQSRKFNAQQKETVAMLNSIFNTVDQGIVLLDRQARVKAFNLTASRLTIHMLGNEMQENAAFEEFLLPEMVETFRTQFNETLQAQQNQGEWLYRFSPTAEFWFGVSYSAVTDDSGAVLGVCLSLIDITDRKRSDALFRSQFNEIENNNRELDKLVKILSHDLRAPMNSVTGLINLARDEKDPAEFGKYLSMMEKSVKKLETFTNDMIASLKNRGSLQIQAVAVYQLVNEVIDELRFGSDAGDIRFENQIAPEVSIPSDPARLRIIFSNLISNAIRYHDRTKTDRFIRVSLEQYPLLDVFSVQDNGIGIAEADHQRIFETYVTLGNVQGSSGLGLSNVKDAVQKLQGKIDLESKPGKGTTFRIQLPAS